MAPRKKSARKSAPGRPFQRGHDPRRGRGPAKGAPTAGRPPDEFKRLLAALASREETLTAVQAILDDPSHPQFIRALEFVSERGYGKVSQGVELTGAEGGPIAVTVTRRIIHATSDTATGADD